MQAQKSGQHRPLASELVTFSKRVGLFVRWPLTKVLAYTRVWLVTEIEIDTFQSSRIFGVIHDL